MNLVLLRLIALYAGLSVLAFGGGNGVIPCSSPPSIGITGFPPESSWICSPSSAPRPGQGR